MTEMNLAPVADLYVTCVVSSRWSSKVRDQKASREQSWGVLHSLELLVGMDEACRLVEAAIERSDRGFIGGAEELLYDFWKLPRPAPA